MLSGAAETLALFGPKRTSLRSGQEVPRMTWRRELDAALAVNRGGAAANRHQVYGSCPYRPRGAVARIRATAINPKGH